MEDKIDIHRTVEKCDKALRRLEADEVMNQKNKELIIRFLWDCKMGKTIKKGAKKKIGERRVLKYLYGLKTLSCWLEKAFDEASQAEMEKLVMDIDENVHKNGEVCYTDETKVDFKRIIRKFFGWLGKAEMVKFMDMSCKAKEVPAITREEVEEKLINSTPDTMLKAAIMVLFDGGARVEELLNLRLKDLTKRKYQNNNECFWINIRYSKTFSRTIPLPLSTKYLSQWAAEHPEKSNPEAQIFPISYNMLRKKVTSLARTTLKKRVNIHMLRHSSATYWAAKMNKYQLCAKYGWSFSSDMPDRYVKRKGIIFDEIAEKGDVDQASRLEKENRVLKEKMENIEQEYQKVRKALEFIMPVVMEKMEDEDFKKKMFERRKERLMLNQERGDLSVHNFF